MIQGTTVIWDLSCSPEAPPFPNGSRIIFGYHSTLSTINIFLRIYKKRKIMQAMRTTVRYKGRVMKVNESKAIKCIWRKANKVLWLCWSATAIFWALSFFERIFLYQLFSVSRVCQNNVTSIYRNNGKERTTLWLQPFICVAHEKTI